jgi:hypothetical protein
MVAIIFVFFMPSPAQKKNNGGLYQGYPLKKYIRRELNDNGFLATQQGERM